MHIWNKILKIEENTQRALSIFVFFFLFPTLSCFTTTKRIKLVSVGWEGVEVQSEEPLVRVEVLTSLLLLKVTCLFSKHILIPVSRCWSFMRGNMSWSESAFDCPYSFNLSLSALIGSTASVMICSFNRSIGSSNISTCWPFQWQELPKPLLCSTSRLVPGKSQPVDRFHLICMYYLLIFL